MAIAGIHIESSTFSPQRTRQEDFLTTRGAEMLDRYPFLNEKDFASIQPVPLAHFRAIPGGQVKRSCYESMKAEILDRLTGAGEIDAFYFDVHGAMCVEGLEDAEADLLTSIRSIIGPKIPITCSQDLHGNISDELVEQLDFVTTYRTAPHIDWMETRERAVRILLSWFAHPVPIYRARVGIPVLVSGEMSSTETEPGKGLYAPLARESEIAGVWDASLWVGYAWADQKRSMASAVVTGTEEEAVKQTASSIAARYWNARKDFQFISPAGSAEWCIDEALKKQSAGVFLSDAGDNPTAGAAGDVTATLSVLLADERFAEGSDHTAIFASIPDAEAIAVCRSTGIDGEVTLCIGGKLDPIHGSPLEIHGIVRVIDPADPVGGTVAVVKCGNVNVILTEKRKPFHKRQDFLSVGLDPLEHTVTVVKIGYLEPELKAMASHHLLVLSPGAVQPLITAIDYRELSRPIYPLDDEFTWTPAPRVFVSHPAVP